MTAAELELSHSVELEITANGKTTTLLTAVEKIIDFTVLMTPIQVGGKIVGFPPDYKVTFLYPEDGKVYCWKNVSVKPVRHENKVYHSVFLPAEAETTNRRGSYRVYIGEEMHLSSFTKEGMKSHRVLVKDVSENGMAFYSKDEFDIGRTVRLSLRVNGGAELHLSCQIVRIQPPEEGSGATENLYGCKLIERNKLLTNYLMKIQVERQRQKMGW